MKAFESSPRDLAIGHGFRACSFINKRKKLDFHTSWDQEAEQNTEKKDEFGRILVPRALNRSKQMRKAGLDNFSKILGLKKPQKPLIVSRSPADL